jgi:hypothetical protein
MTTEARHFGDGPTQWSVWRTGDGPLGSSEPGWALPGDTKRYISSDDPVWSTVLANAQTTYGDPNIHYNTDDTSQERYLVFGDGTRLPTDGTVAYHDAAGKRNWIQNSDGSVTPADNNFKPTGPAFQPYGYQKGANNQSIPVDAHGQQVGSLINGTPTLPPGATGWHDANGISTPVNAKGDYYTVDPSTGRLDYFDKDNKPISEDKYQADTGQPPGQQTPPGQQPQTTPGQKHPLQSPKVDIPDGMTTPQYPSWATDVDPDIPNQMTGVIARLYELFGHGRPAQADLPEFPFRTDTGEKSGIDAYDSVKKDFQRIEQEFDTAAQEFKKAVAKSANVTKAGRDAINNAISTFNSNVASLKEADWDGLLQAESTMLDTVKTAVQNAAGTQQDVPENPNGGPTTPAPPDQSAPPPLDPASLGSQPESDPNKKLNDLLNGLGNPLGAGMPMGGNPLGALGGLNPLGGMGSPMGGGGANPLSPVSDAIKPLTQLADRSDKNGADDKKSPITPLNPTTPPPPAGAAAAAVPAPPGQQPGQASPAAPKVDPAGNATTKPTVRLPDGKTIDAPNGQAAQAAQNALDKASPGGDPAQKAYDGTGVEMPSDGKNFGARVDPADMQPGDVLKWHDKTMVAVAPGLVADPTQPGVTHTLDEVLKDQKGFEGVFRPTAVDPTLTATNSAPPLTDPQTPPAAPHPPGAGPDTHQPPPGQHSGPAQQTPPAPTPNQPAPAPNPPPDNSIPLSGPGPAAPQPPPPASTPAPPPSSTVPQAAPPSPFESPHPPPATRTTRQERIASGAE